MGDHERFRSPPVTAPDLPHGRASGAPILLYYHSLSRHASADPIAAATGSAPVIVKHCDGDLGDGYGLYRKIGPANTASGGNARA
jgi:hypothetical protein